MTPYMSKLLAIPTALGGRRLAALAFLLAAIVAGGRTATIAAQEPTASEREDALKAFTARVNAYVELKRSLERGVPAVKPGDAGTGKVEKVQDAMLTQVMPLVYEATLVMKAQARRTRRAQA